MLKIHTLPLGQLQANCYLVHAEGSKACAVIDPGGDYPILRAKLEALGLSVDAVLLTHGHFDHVGAVEELVEATGCQLWMSQSDWSQFPNPVTNYLYPIANCDFTEVRFCEEGEIIPAGGLEFTVLQTPGHSHGSVCFACGDALFTGDTLFAGGMGRTDLPGGNGRFMGESLARLAEIDKNYTVYPGHGPATTLAIERSCNPYLR